jgi:AraC-like DNA-binding protein
MRNLAVGRSMEMRRFTLYLDDVGVPWRACAERLGLPPHVPSGDTFLPTHLVVQFLGDIVVRESFLEMSAQAYIDKSGERGRNPSRGRVESAFLSAPTLYGGLRAFCDAARLEWSHLRFWISETHEFVWFCSVLPVTGNRRGIEQLVQARIIGIVALIQEYLGIPWRPDTLLLETQTIPSRMMAEIVDCNRIIPGASFSAVPIHKKMLSRSSTRFRASSDSTPCDGIGREDNDWNWLRSLQAILPEYAVDNQLSIKQIAEIANVSSRTLQRALSEKGVTFRDLVANARLEVARQKLAEPSIKIDEISRLLGYSESTHFTRAFRRYSGRTPTEYRRDLTTQS